MEQLIYNYSNYIMGVILLALLLIILLFPRFVNKFPNKFQPIMALLTIFIFFLLLFFTACVFTISDSQTPQRYASLKE